MSISVAQPRSTSSGSSRSSRRSTATVAQAKKEPAKALLDLKQKEKTKRNRAHCTAPGEACRCGSTSNGTLQQHPAARWQASSNAQAALQNINMQLCLYQYLES